MPDLFDNLNLPPEPIKEELPKKETLIETYFLTDDQKKLIIDKIEKGGDHQPPSLKELGRICYGEEMDGRDRRCKLIKEFCAELDFRPKVMAELNRAIEVDLTVEHKLFITNHAATMSAVEIARTLFNNNLLKNTNREVRAVNEFIKTLNTAVVFNANNGDIPDDVTYQPPKTRTQCLHKVSKYTHEKLDESKLNQQQIKNLDSLISHLHVYRLTHQINTYDSQIDRDLFESTFIRYTWPKAHDLSSEEVDQFIVLSIETVISSSIQRRIEMLQRLLDEAVAEEKDGDNKRRISMSVVEAINTLNNEYHQSVTRQGKLLGDLNVKRSARIKDRVSENQSLVTLIEFWKNYENRQQLIALAELRKKSIKEEVNRIKNLDQLKAEIFGVGEDIVDA